jgi:hypothetical protein
LQIAKVDAGGQGDQLDVENKQQPQQQQLKLPEGVTWEIGVLSTEYATECWKVLRALEFKALMYRGKPMPRPKAPFFVDVKRDDKGTVLIPLYTFPGLTFKSKAHPPWVDLADDKNPACKVLRELRDKHAPGANQVLVTLYRDGKDNIGPHSDKKKDLVPGKPIIDIILMANSAEKRIFQVLKIVSDKKQEADSDSESDVDSDSDADEPEPMQWEIPAGHGDKITLTSQANDAYMHAVPPIKGKKKAQQAGERISLVFRYIQTYYNPQTREIVQL